MVAYEATEAMARLKVLHRMLATEGPTERTGRVLKALAEICDPVREFARMWDAMSGPFGKRQAAVAAVEAAIEYLR